MKLTLQGICLLWMTGCSLGGLDNLDLSGLFPSPEPEPQKSSLVFSTRDEARSYLDKLEDRTPIEGIWEWGGGQGPQSFEYEIVIVRNDKDKDVDVEYEFIGIIIDSTNERFVPGDLKILLDSTKSSTSFQGVYFLGDAIRRPAVFQFSEPNLIELSLLIQRQWEEVKMHRLISAVR